MKQMKRFILQVQSFSLNLYFEQKKQKKHGKQPQFPLRPKTSHAALTPHAPVPKTA